jgi:dCTP deaminase
MFLNGHDIERICQDLFPDMKQFNPDCVQQAGYDLRIGSEVFLSEERVPIRLDDDNPFVVLPPGQFALIQTYEKVFVPRGYVAFISIRSTYKFQGLINISGFHVDPTYKGHLIYAVQNVGPNDIRLKYREPVFMIMWAQLTSEWKGPERRKGYDGIPVELMAQLGGPSVTLVSLQKKVEELSLSLRIYGGLGIAAFLTVLGLLLSRVIK